VKDIFLDEMFKPISLFRSLVPIYNLPIIMAALRGLMIVRICVVAERLTALYTLRIFLRTNMVKNSPEGWYYYSNRIY